MIHIPIFVIGCHGELGTSLIKRAPGKYNIIGIGRDENKLINNSDYEYIKCDVLNRKDIKELFKAYKPRYAINSAAMTDVDLCEVEKEKCWKSNVETLQNIIQGCKSNETNLIHISTDYIFDGKNGPYNEKSKPFPINYYGKSKLAAENAVITSTLEYSIIRTSTLYGYTNAKKKENFARKLWNKIKKGEKVKAVNDEIRNLTITVNLADSIWKLVNLGKNGIYNIAGKEMISKYTFAVEFAKYFGFDEKLIEIISSGDLRNTARRPKNSGLLVEKAEKELYLNLINMKQSFKIFQEQIKQNE